MIRDRNRVVRRLVEDSKLVKVFGKVTGKIPIVPKAQKKREQVLTWMDAYMDYGMILDIPAWVIQFL